MKKTFVLAALLLVVASLAYAQCETLTFITESLPNFFVGTPAHFDIEVSGGTAPYTFAVTGGAFPAGLHMNNNGKIRGVPTELADTTVFVTVTDANGCMLTSAFAVRVD